MPVITWVMSESADADNHDQETDLAAIGNPGDACWASVAPESRPDGSQYWHWAIYRRWLWDDIDSDPENTLANGESAGEADAKKAVETWVLTQVARP